MIYLVTGMDLRLVGDIGNCTRATAPPSTPPAPLRGPLWLQFPDEQAASAEAIGFASQSIPGMKAFQFGLEMRFFFTYI